jgi:hypothetical protein
MNGCFSRPKVLFSPRYVAATKKLVPKEVGSGYPYSPSCREATFSETHIHRVEFLRIETVKRLPTPPIGIDS